MRKIKFECVAEKKVFWSFCRNWNFFWILPLQAFEEFSDFFVPDDQDKLSETGSVSVAELPSPARVVRVRIQLAVRSELRGT